MSDEYFEFEELLIEELLIEGIDIKDSIQMLAPEVQSMIIAEYGNIENYIDGINDLERMSYFFERISLQPWKEQKIVLLRFGLIDGRMRTLEEVSNIMHITRERVRLIEQKCLRPFLHARVVINEIHRNGLQRISKI